MVTCFKCGQEGHVSAECKWMRMLAADLAPIRIAGTPPTEGYLAARQSLGMPTRTPQLENECSWCGASPMNPCVNVGTGRPTMTHQARRAGRIGLAPEEGDRKMRAIAAEQSRESRQARGVLASLGEGSGAPAPQP
jgi:hypothetical protein